MTWVVATRVRWKLAPKWGWAVYYGHNLWPSHCFWIVPGTVKR